MHSPSEIAFMRNLLVAIFDSANSLHEEVYAVKTIDAINMASAPGVGITRSAAENLIDTFVQDGWLVHSKGGFVTLSERGLLELRDYLIETFNDVEEEEEEEEEVSRGNSIKQCRACEEIVTRVLSYGCD
jgi:non-structural maintenance of chromosomes element 1